VLVLSSKAEDLNDNMRLVEERTGGTSKGVLGKSKRTTIPYQTG
jgi:hypothetical protein